MTNQNQLSYVHILPNGPKKCFIKTRIQPTNKQRLILWIINDISGWRYDPQLSNTFICCGVR